MDKRKAELEAKRAKLAELRKAREERKTGPSTDAGARESPDVGLNSPETRGVGQSNAICQLNEMA